MKVFLIMLQKELKQILANKKSFLICLLFLFYTPLLNMNAQNNVLSLDFIVPLLFMISGCYPSEYTYATMNAEFENKTYEMIYLSKVNPIYAILSKVFIPTLLGIIICFSSIFINNMIARYTQNMYILFLNFQLSLFLMFTVIFSNLFTLWMLNLTKKTTNRQLYTFAIVINLSIILSIFFIYYQGFKILSLLVMITLNILLFLHNKYLMKHYFYESSRHQNRFFTTHNNNLILIQNSYIHTWDLKKSFLLLILTITLAFYFLNITSPEIMIIAKFIPIIFSSMSVNTIIYQSYVIDLKMKINEFYCIANINKHKILLTKMLYTITLNIINITAFTMILNDIFSITEIITYLILNIFMCIFMCGLSTFTNIVFHKAFGLLLSICNILICFILFFNQIHIILIIFMIVCLYLFTYYRFFL